MSYIQSLNQKQLELLKAYQQEYHLEMQNIVSAKEQMKDIIENLLDGFGLDKKEDKEDYQEAKRNIREFYKLTFDDKVQELLSFAENISFIDDNVK